MAKSKKKRRRLSAELEAEVAKLVLAGLRTGARRACRCSGVSDSKPKGSSVPGFSEDDGDALLLA